MALAGAAPLPDAPAFCELTPCLPGLAHRRALAHDETVAGVACKHGTEVGTDAAGHLMYCTTARAQTLGGLPVAADAYSLFHPDGSVYQSHLAAPHAFALRDGSTVACAADLVAIADDGSLMWCMLRAAHGVARAGTGLLLFPSGAVRAATLDAPAVVGRLHVPAGTSVEWDDRGVAIGGDLEAPLAVGNLHIRGEFTVHGNGALHAVELAEAATVQHHDFPVDAHLELRDDGTLAAAIWQSAHGFMIHGEPWSDTTTATYDHDGRTMTSATEHWQSRDAPHPP
jgi:hypothetical protein